MVHTEIVETWRPWFALYNVRLKLKPKPEKKLGLIEQMLPDEMLCRIFAHLTPTTLGVAQCVSQQWRFVGTTPALWKAACNEAFFNHQDINSATALKPYNGSYKRMFLERPHLRFDGIYVSRNTYIKTGVTEWRVTNPVHLVCYYRYLRFFPDNRFLYRTTPDIVKVAAKSMINWSSVNSSKSTRTINLQQGKYMLDGSRLYTAMRYENQSLTEIRSRLKLRSTCPGANNRLDIETIFSWDREDGRAMPMVDIRSDEIEDEQEGVAQRRHTRGMSPYVFIPWEQVSTSQLNLPVTEMDVYIPG